jgi:hypothetical protein
VARIAPAWTIKKGEPAWNVVEQIRLSPAPKLGGWAGCACYSKYFRRLSQPSSRRPSISEMCLATASVADLPGDFINARSGAKDVTAFE